jgi:hypothetical protein
MIWNGKADRQHSHPRLPGRSHSARHLASQSGDKCPSLGLLWRWSGPLRLGLCRATSSWSVFILESRHTRTLDEPGKASPGHAIREQFVKLTRAAKGTHLSLGSRQKGVTQGPRAVSGRYIV